jgi:hypothetical protein
MLMMKSHYSAQMPIAYFFGAGRTDTDYSRGQ